MQLELPLTVVGDGHLPLGPLPGDSSPSASHAAPATLRPPLSTLPAAPDPASSALEFVRHPRARRYVLRVRSNGTVRVTIPRGGSKREAEDFARRQAPWVERQRERLARDEAERPAMRPEIDRDLLQRARNELPARILELASRHGLRVSRVSVRNQRWRWGSCSRSGHICLNWRLVLMPDSVRDYVMIHELMHLKRMDHSPRFWKLVAAACPGYEAARAWLRQYGRA